MIEWRWCARITSSFVTPGPVPGRRGCRLRRRSPGRSGSPDRILRRPVVNRLMPLRRWTALAVLLAACVAPALWHRPASPAPAADASAYLFVSPNTREDLDVDQAMRQLDSPEHARYRRLAGDVLRRLGVRQPRVSDALGEWQGAAENSLLVTIHEPVDAATVACAAALFGLAAKQKTVLAFHPEADGEHVLAVIELRGRSLRSSRELLDRRGFYERT